MKSQWEKEKERKERGKSQREKEEKERRERLKSQWEKEEKKRMERLDRAPRTELFQGIHNQMEADAKGHGGNARREPGNGWRRSGPRRDRPQRQQSGGDRGFRGNARPWRTIPM